MPTTTSTAAKLTATPATTGRNAPATMIATSTRKTLARTKKSCSPLGSPAPGGWRFVVADMLSSSARRGALSSAGSRQGVAAFPHVDPRIRGNHGTGVRADADGPPAGTADALLHVPGPRRPSAR